jgi:hypothetical protein
MVAGSDVSCVCGDGFMPVVGSVRESVGGRDEGVCLEGRVEFQGDSESCPGGASPGLGIGVGFAPNAEAFGFREGRKHDVNMVEAEPKARKNMVQLTDEEHNEELLLEECDSKIARLAILLRSNTYTSRLNHNP